MVFPDILVSILVITVFCLPSELDKYELDNSDNSYYYTIVTE